MAEEIKNFQVDRKYTVKYIKAAGVKTGDGFEVEANGDNRTQTEHDAYMLYLRATETVKPSIPVIG